MSRTAVIVSDAEDSTALCRLCMIYHEHFVNIFIPNNTFRICAEEAIHDLLSLKVAVGDGLPSNICHQCVKKLMDFRDFKEMCLKTAAELGKCDLDNFLKVSKIKDEDAANMETSRKGSSQENTFVNDIHVMEVYVTIPDELAMGNESPAKEELWSCENALVVKEEVCDGEHCIESDVPVNAYTSVAVDPLAVDMMALKEEAQEQDGVAGGGYSLSDTSPHNHIQVTEVFVPVPDKLAMGIVSHAEADSRSTELMVKEEIGEGLDCSEIDAQVVSLSSVNVDPLAVDTTIDMKVEYDIRMGDCSLNIEVRREDGIPENEGSGKECSGGGALLSEIKPENQVDCCNYSREISVVPDDFLDKFVFGRQENSQHQLPSNSSYDHMSEENLQFEYSSANSLIPHTYSGKIVKRKENMKPSDSNKISFLPNNLKQFKCDACGMNFRYSSELKKHSVIRTGVKPHACDVCGKMFSKKCNLKSHSIVHTGVKPFRCNVCEKNFTGKSSLKRHLAIHTGLKPYKCAVCGKMFTQSGSLKSHSVLHTRGKPFKCDACGKTFSRSDILATHSVVHTGEKPFQCNVCGKNFTGKSSLKRHLVTHTGVQPFKCNVCGKMFSRSHRLKDHSKIHTGENSFACDVCGKNFIEKDSLKRHIDIHTGLKPYKCAVCGKMFTRNGSLKSHLVVHTGVKPFKCDVCGKTFSRSDILATHSVVHTGEKPFQCNVCGKNFGVESSLRRHLVTHTGVQPFKCNICGKMFSRGHRLKDHSKIHTGEN